MKLPRTRAEDAALDSDDARDDPEPQPEAPRPARGYRVAGDLEVRSKELEQELVQMKVRLRLMEREVYAARRVVRRRKGATATSRGGVGATLASVIALVLYGLDVTAAPNILLGLILLGFVFGALLGMHWHTDDNFPDAPPPRLP